ncbi:MAG: PTS fructose transporter subunit IIA [Rhodoferax sp.]|jgi:PTS system ascorbate-specific IIA component|nr:PTS fructose transporter subunit IIA [Rhodoferax sp.]
MSIAILIIAHAPLASALRACVLHVFPEVERSLSALDVQANEPPENTLAMARIMVTQLDAPSVLILTDVFGATPCNVAQQLVDGVHSKLVAGVNLPMLLRTVNYRHEPLEALVARALAGGNQCIMQVAVSAPLNQTKNSHDPIQHNHHQ